MVAYNVRVQFRRCWPLSEPLLVMLRLGEHAGDPSLAAKIVPHRRKRDSIEDLLVAVANDRTIEVQKFRNNQYQFNRY